METRSVRPPVLVPFVCPVCSGANAVELVPLSRSGGTTCVACKRFLSSTDVMRAMHAPRTPGGVAPTTRPRAAAKPMVWPPTSASRAAIPPLKKRGEGEED